jgi:hypothetical protein
LATRKRPDEPKWLRWAVVGAILFLAAANIPFWIGTPQEFFSSSFDRGQGTGVAMAVLIFASPIIAGWGWLFGYAAGIFVNGRDSVRTRNLRRNPEFDPEKPKTVFAAIFIFGVLMFGLYLMSHQ